MVELYQLFPGNLLVQEVSPEVVFTLKSKAAAFITCCLVLASCC